MPRSNEFACLRALLRTGCGGSGRGRSALALAAVAATALATVVVPQVSAQATPAQSTRAHQLPSAPAAHAAPMDNLVAREPYLGWSSWSLESTDYPGVDPNGQESWLTEAHVLQQTDVVASTLKPHGYEYINIDAGWWDGYDAYGRPEVSATKFPDGMGHVGDYVHARGLKLGIYLPVGLNAAGYGDGTTPIFGTTNCFTKDIVYPDLRTTNGWNNAYKINYASPCAQAYNDSIAEEFAGWGVDFMKLDGVGPGSQQGGADYDNTADVTSWSQALKATGRPIQFTISWALSHNEADVWKADANGWRVDTDVECYCGTLVTWNNSVKQRWNDVVQWIPDAGPGHWNNLDSLDVGVGAMDGLTNDERQSYATLWAVEAAPLYSGDDLTKLDSYGLSLLTDDEVLAVDQAGTPAKPVSQSSDQQTWYTRNADGSDTVALFNLGDAPATVTADWGDLGITGTASVRDLWSRSDIGLATGSFSAQLPVHGSRLLRITPAAVGNSPTVPTNLHATAATPSSLTLAWDRSGDRTASVTGYDIYSAGAEIASATGSSATLTGLTPSTTYRLTLVARDSAGRSSAAGPPLSITTEQSGGLTVHEAEAPANTLTGGASVGDCSGCSGGKKVGNLGNAASLTFNNVTVSQAGTYLVRIGYVDGDSSRTAVVTVDGTAFDLPLSGTNDNNWSTAQTVTVPMQLRAGANTIQFGNPTEYVSDIDSIAL